MESRLSKLVSPYGKWENDEIHKEKVYHVTTPHMFIQAAGYLKHVHYTTGDKAVYYRGQESLYKGSLKPSLYRNLETENAQDRLNHMISEYLSAVKCEGKMLRNVPAYVREPLLQHYGIRTRWIDLVDNIWVALWFACHTAHAVGKKAEFLHFERRKPREDQYAYVLLVGTDYHHNNTANEAGLLVGPETVTIDLRIAAPSVFIRPHAQHAILTCMKASQRRYCIDYKQLIAGIIRVSLEDAIQWLGNGVLLTPHVLFPSPVYDYGYQELLRYSPETREELGAINHIGA